MLVHRFVNLELNPVFGQKRLSFRSFDCEIDIFGTPPPADSSIKVIGQFHTLNRGDLKLQQNESEWQCELSSEKEILQHLQGWINRAKAKNKL